MAVFTNIATNVVDAVQIAAATTTYYTAPATAGGFAKIVEMTVANDTTTAITFTIYKVPNAGTAGDDNIIVKDQTLASGDSFSITELLGDIYVEPSGLIRAIASVASQATLHITAFEIS